MRRSCSNGRLGNNNTAPTGQCERSLTTRPARTTRPSVLMRSIDNTGSKNVGLGTGAGSRLTTGSNNIVIGTDVVGEAGDSNTIRIGKGITRTLIDGINGATASGGAAVFVVGEGGRLGTLTSSARFKDDIKPMDKASEAILALKPVSFRYKKEVDPQRFAQFGLVAEDVEKINPDLVIRDAQGRPQTVRYEQVNAMLLNEFLKEHRKNEEQEATISQLKTELQATATHQQKQIDALTAGLQKVSAQLEAHQTCAASGQQSLKPRSQPFHNQPSRLSAWRLCLRLPRSRLFELALVLVRFDYVASFIVNANHSIL